MYTLSECLFVKKNHIMKNILLRYAVNTISLIASIYSANSVEKDFSDRLKLLKQCKVEHPNYLAQ